MSPDDATPPALPLDTSPEGGAAGAKPSGSLRFYWFDGILEGVRPAEEGPLREAVHRLCDSGFGRGAVIVHLSLPPPWPRRANPHAPIFSRRTRMPAASSLATASLA